MAMPDSPPERSPGERLRDAAEQMARIERGDETAPREFIYSDGALVEIRRGGRTVWPREPSEPRSFTRLDVSRSGGTLLLTARFRRPGVHAAVAWIVLAGATLAFLLVLAVGMVQSDLGAVPMGMVIAATLVGAVWVLDLFYGRDEIRVREGVIELRHMGALRSIVALQTDCGATRIRRRPFEHGYFGVRLLNRRSGRSGEIRYRLHAEDVERLVSLLRQGCEPGTEHAQEHGPNSTDRRTPVPPSP